MSHWLRPLQIRFAAAVDCVLSRWWTTLQHRLNWFKALKQKVFVNTSMLRLDFISAQRKKRSQRSGWRTPFCTLIRKVQLAPWLQMPIQRRCIGRFHLIVHASSINIFMPLSGQFESASQLFCLGIDFFSFVTTKALSFWKMTGLEKLLHRTFYIICFSDNRVSKILYLMS